MQPLATSQAASQKVSAPSRACTALIIMDHLAVCTSRALTLHAPPEVIVITPP